MKAIGLVIALLISSSSVAQSATTEDDQHPRELEAIEFASQWLELLEENDSTRSFELYSELYKSTTTAISWENELNRERLTLGELRSRELILVVVHQDPDNAPFPVLPGTYAAVEFDSVYEHASKHVQLILLHSQNNEPFRVMKREVWVYHF